MSNTEKMILSDAIATAIKAEKSKVQWRNVSIILMVVCLFLLALLLGG